MKKLFALLVVGIAAVTTMNAQKSLGLRLGGGTATGAEVSFQKDLGTANRLEADLGSWGSSLALTGIYQWVWDLKDLGDGFKWYAGPGVGIRLFDGFGAGINGQIGMEYNIPDVPLQISLDARPGWYSGGSNGFGMGAALGVRYKF